MNQKNLKIKAIDLIEKELSGQDIGTIAFTDDENKPQQLITPFLYLDKNIYFLVNSSEEKIVKYINDKDVSFSIFKNIKLDKQENGKTAYAYLEIIITGSAKAIIKKNVLKVFGKGFKDKYYIDDENVDINIKKLENLNIFMIDSFEIHAAEVTGGLN